MIIFVIKSSPKAHVNYRIFIKTEKTMNNIFNIKRFGAVLRRDFATSWLINAIYLGAIILILILFHGITGSEEMRASIHFHNIEGILTFASILVAISCVFINAYTYKAIDKANTRLDFIMLPASTLEKMTSKLIFSWLIPWTMLVTAYWFFGQGEPYYYYYGSVNDSHFDVLTQRIHDYDRPHLYFIFTAMATFFSMVVLSWASIIRKFSIILAAASIGLTIYIIYLMEAHINCEWMDPIVRYCYQGNNNYRVVVIILWLILAAANFAIQYFIINRKQIR